MYFKRSFQVALTSVATIACLQLALPPSWAFAGADPAFNFYGYGEISPNPNPAIVDENTHIIVTVSNSGDATATNVAVKLSYNDWGVTFQGWQEIDVVTIPSILAGGTAEAEFDFVFENRAHTCLEALIVSADEDSNPNNDRAQINMEVVNAGESFDYYVPIVNNGDDDLLVEIRGNCDRLQDPAGAVVGRCRPIDRLELVPAGEEVLVRVEIEFLPGTPRGIPMDFVVDAFDFFDPGNVNARNHVILRVVYNTPRGLMEDCLAALDTLPPLPSPGRGQRSNGLDKKIGEIASHIDKALTPNAWVDDSRLNHGHHDIQYVFEQSSVAVQQLLTLTESKHLPIEWKIELNRCVGALTDATRILLQTAIRDTGGSIEAELLLEEGDRLRLAGKEKAAIRDYRIGHAILIE